MYKRLSQLHVSASSSSSDLYVQPEDDVVYYINMVVFLIAISIWIGLLSFKIHNGDGTPKERCVTLVVTRQ